MKQDNKIIRAIKKTCTHCTLLLRTAPLVDPERRQRRRPLLVQPVLRPVVDGQLLALGERLCVDHMPVHSVHSSLVQQFSSTTERGTRVRTRVETAHRTPACSSNSQLGAGPSLTSRARDSGTAFPSMPVPFRSVATYLLRVLTTCQRNTRTQTHPAKHTHRNTRTERVTCAHTPEREREREGRTRERERGHTSFFVSGAPQ